MYQLFQIFKNISELDKCLITFYGHIENVSELIHRQRIFISETIEFSAFSCSQFTKN